MVSHGDLGDDVCAFGEACFHEALVLLQRLFDHLQLGEHVCHEEIPHPALPQRQGLQLRHTHTHTGLCFSVHATSVRSGAGGISFRGSGSKEKASSVALEHTL